MGEPKLLLATAARIWEPQISFHDVKHNQTKPLAANRGINKTHIISRNSKKYSYSTGNPEGELWGEYTTLTICPHFLKNFLRKLLLTNNPANHFLFSSLTKQANCSFWSSSLCSATSGSKFCSNFIIWNHFQQNTSIKKKKEKEKLTYFDTCVHTANIQSSKRKNTWRAFQWGVPSLRAGEGRTRGFPYHLQKEKGKLLLINWKK